MPLRIKVPGRKNSASDTPSNGKPQEAPKEHQNGGQNLKKNKPSVQEQKKSSKRKVSPSSLCDSGSSQTRNQQDKKEESGRKESTSSTKGIAAVRKTSRDCVVPDNIGIPALTDSPTFKIEDFSFNAAPEKTAPILAKQVMAREHYNCVTITELAESPQRYGLGLVKSPDSRLSVSPSHDLYNSDEDHMVFPPSSPMLVAIRTAVDSLNQYEDFEILEEIGAGFFAQVFKVRKQL